MNNYVRAEQLRFTPAVVILASKHGQFYVIKFLPCLYNAVIYANNKPTISNAP